jgi:cell division protein FtsI (penicillin-binding protein 3)
LKSRIVILFSGLVLLWAILALRGAVLQVFPNKRLETLQARQFQTVITLQNRRGAIVDRAGRDLALSTKAYSIYADPKLLENKKWVARKVAGILGLSAESVYSKIKDAHKRFVWIQRLAEEEKGNQIKALNIRGLQAVEEYKRVYPNENLLSQVIGFVGQEGQGLEGLELSFDAALQGKKNKVTVRRDARGRPLVADGLMFAENPDGAEIKLTVDAELQHVLETELNETISNFEADNAMGIILDAKTSAILAMSSAPSFDANKATKLRPDQRRNRIVTDAFEPGSTLKTFVIAAALKEKIVQPNTKYNTENGRFQVGDRIIREAETHEKWAQLTVSEILRYSSNIGTTKIGFDLGPEALRKGLLDFGFGQKSGVDLPGDGRGLLQPLPWRPHLLANISFGQGVAVTAMQMANAYATIANGGMLNTPYIVQSIRDPETGETTEYQPKPQRRVLSAEDSASLRMMLTGVTSEGGTGVKAQVDGFLVAGKTGTAQKVNPNGGGYMKNAYVSSFAGFIPATEPKFVIYVMVDHPKKNSYYGSQVAAPLFSRLASYAVRREGVAPVLLTEKNFVDKELGTPLARRKKGRRPAAQVISRETKKAMKDLKNPTLPENNIVTAEQLMQKANPAVDGDSPYPEQSDVVPDLTRMSLREAIKQASVQDLQVRIRGTGLVSEIIPPPGSPIPSSKKITVILKPNEGVR